MYDREDDGSYAPNLSTYLAQLEEIESHAGVEHCIEIGRSLLKRRQIKHSRAASIATISLVAKVVEFHQWSNVGALIARVREVGARFIEAQPREPAVGNIVRRVLALIREEAEENRAAVEETSKRKGGRHAQDDLQRAIPGLKALSITTPPNRTMSGSLQQAGSSTMFNLLAHPNATATNTGLGSPSAKSVKKSPNSEAIKADVLEGLAEIKDELSQATDQIASYAPDQIHPEETFLTHGSSITVQKYFLEAAKKGRRFRVICAETHPNDSRRVHHLATHSSKDRNKAAGIPDTETGKVTEWAKPLSEAGIQVILTSDAAVFAFMARVDKVILSPVAVLANGGMITSAGARSILLAADARKVPVMALAPTYKLSPVFPYDKKQLIQFGNPMKVLPYQDAEAMSRMRVLNPLLDYVEPKLVDLFMTNIGGVPPTYLHKVLEDNYRREDLVLVSSEKELEMEERRKAEQAVFEKIEAEIRARPKLESRAEHQVGGQKKVIGEAAAGA